MGPTVSCRFRTVKQRGITRRRTVFFFYNGGNRAQKCSKAHYTADTHYDKVWVYFVNISTSFLIYLFTLLLPLKWGCIFHFTLSWVIPTVSLSASSVSYEYIAPLHFQFTDLENSVLIFWMVQKKDSYI